VNLSFALFPTHAAPMLFYYRKIRLALAFSERNESDLSFLRGRFRFALEIQDSNALFGL